MNDLWGFTKFKFSEKEMMGFRSGNSKAVFTPSYWKEQGEGGIFIGYGKTPSKFDVSNYDYLLMFTSKESVVELKQAVDELVRSFEKEK